MENSQHVIRLIYPGEKEMLGPSYAVEDREHGLDVALADARAIGLQFTLQELVGSERERTPTTPHFGPRHYIGKIFRLSTSGEDRLSQPVINMCLHAGVKFAVKTRTGLWQPLRRPEEVYDLSTQSWLPNPYSESPRRPQPPTTWPTPKP